MMFAGTMDVLSADATNVLSGDIDFGFCGHLARLVFWPSLATYGSVWNDDRWSAKSQIWTPGTRFAHQRANGGRIFKRKI